MVNDHVLLIHEQVTAEELEIAALNRTVERLRENATALLAVIDSRNTLIDELNQRIEVYEDETHRRRRTVRRQGVMQAGVGGHQLSVLV